MRTDMTKLTAAFRNFSNAPENATFCPHVVRVFMCSECGSQNKQLLFSYTILTGFYIRGGERLLRGTIRLFKYISD